MNPKKFQLFFLILATISVSHSESTTRDKNNFSFSYPPDWVQSQDKDRKNCIFLKKKKNGSLSNPEEWEIRICSHAGTLDEILKFTVFFKGESGWIASGSMDEQPAATMRNKFTTFSLETKIPPTCGVSDGESGFHSAAGQCYSAIASCKNNHILLESNGVIKDFQVARKIARSIAFEGCKQNH